ncbi:MAG: zinc-binding alcohol dehydrogenase family protein [Acidobacteriaceae bacterium]|nr:zinc-binding alcohol dehydrogenase family protein [Acidobacteriaceae bacterium]MBV9501781.1 zinc-binding alcohol dehydrogenase family protein [Acidobacteriaceae bacterium]
MRAFSIVQPGRTELIELPQPKPAAGELLLKSRIIGMCGTDLSTYRGKNPLVSYPRIPGHEIAATIVELGADAPPQFAPGMDVTVYPNTSCGRCASCRRGRTNACKFNETLGVQRDGAMKGYFTAPWQKVFVSEGLSLRELSTVEPLAVGFHACERGRVAANDVVAVIGCGMVGLGVIASAVERGATVLAVDLDEEKLALAKQVGAQHAIDSVKHNLEQELVTLTNGLGPDVVVEAVGTTETYRLAVELVAHTGRVVYIGWAKAPVSYETKLFVHKELDILGSRNSLVEFPAVISMLREGRFPVEATISATVPMSGAGDALRQWSESPGSYTKILVDLDK